jgi:hypothetical protein
MCLLMPIMLLDGISSRTYDSRRLRKHGKSLYLSYRLASAGEGRRDAVPEIPDNLRAVPQLGGSPRNALHVRR